MSDDDKPGRPTEDIVRKLIAMNPHLRGEGQSTKDVLSLVTKNMSQAAPQPVAKAPARNLSQELDLLIAEHNVSMGSLQNQRVALKEHEVSLDQQKKNVVIQACQRVIEAILLRDPNLTERKHQVLLDQEKAFLASIGFTPQKLVDAERKGRGSK